MSADNWTVCPQCKNTCDKQMRSNRGLAEASYGKVSAQEYLGLLAEANKEIIPGDTLREDWHIGVEEDGTFSVGYTARCKECGFEFK